MTMKDKVLHMAGRIALALIFVVSGVGKIINWDATVGRMAAKGLPIAAVFLVGAILCELGGGVALMLGFRSKIAALVLAAFLVPATLLFHNFLGLQGPEQQMQMIQFLKNLSIFGGLLAFSASSQR